MNQVGSFKIANVTAINQINNTTIWLTCNNDFDAVAGQFVMVWLPDIGEKPFSIASMDPFGLLIVDVGPFSHALHQLKVGDPLWIKGPLGHGFSIEGESLILVGGGYGSAPLFPLAKEAQTQGKEVDVCLGAQSEPGLLLIDEFIDFGCNVACTTEDGTKGDQGLVTSVVEQAMRNIELDTLYACGPTGMLSALANLCKTYQVNYQLSWEAHMRCGMGLCGSCEVLPSADSSLPVGWLACYDGPVFKQRWGK